MSSFSSITRLLGCRRRAILATICSKFNERSDALIFGSAYHSAMEHGIDEGVKELRKNGLEDQIALLNTMVARQYSFMAQKGITMLEHEIAFELEMEGLTEPFKGFIDGLCEWNGKLWLIEFKTARYIDVEHVPIDSQITAYLWASRRMGMDVEGVLYSVNQKSMDKPPVVLASGQLSTAKNQGCNFSDYAEKAHEIYGDEIPAKVELFMEWLEQNEKPQIVCVATKRTEAQLNRFESMVVKYIEEEQKMKKEIEEKGADAVLRDTVCFPNKSCYQSCDYGAVCKASLLDETIEMNDMTEDKFKEFFA